MNEEEVSNRILAGYEDIALRLSTSEGIAEGLLKQVSSLSTQQIKLTSFLEREVDSMKTTALQISTRMSNVTARISALVDLSEELTLSALNRQTAMEIAKKAEEIQIYAAKKQTALAELKASFTVM